VNWPKLMTCIMTDLTREGQPRGTGISGDDDLAGMAKLQEALGGWFPEGYYKLPHFHELRPP
jgi:hypothetical protein